MKGLDQIDDFLMMNSHYIPTNYTKVIMLLCILGVIIVVGCIFYYKRSKKRDSEDIN